MFISQGPDEEGCPCTYPLACQPQLPLFLGPGVSSGARIWAGAGKDQLLLLPYSLCPLHLSGLSYECAEALQSNMQHRQAQPTWVAPFARLLDLPHVPLKEPRPCAELSVCCSQDGLLPLPLFYNCCNFFSPPIKGKACFADSSSSTVAKPLLSFDSV